MNLTELLDGVVGAARLRGPEDVSITDVQIDSRLVTPGTLFIAISGHKEDGHAYIGDALSRGAVAILAERDAEAPDGVTLFRCDRPKDSLSIIGKKFFGDPAARMTIAGVTGTNGKTTTTFLLRSIFETAGYRTAVVGTVAYYLGDEKRPAPNTTPDALHLNRILAACVEKKITHAALEISSHALALGRVDGLRFASAGFTNLTQDHLDFHSDMNEYFAAKSRLFELTSGRGAVNIDDEYGRELIRRYPRAIPFGAGAGVASARENFTIFGTKFDLVLDREILPVETRLVGRPNISNCLAAAAISLDLGIESDRIAAGLSAAPPPPGRFELVESSSDFAVAVDYAHTPDALERLLKVGRELNPSRLKVVFGCGGDRDRSKRSKMGMIAELLADEIWVTSDNPRTENAEAIIDEIVSGMRGEFRRITDRREAIHDAIGGLDRGDLLLIAGKGHEDYQIIGETKQEFDDRNVARDALERKL